MTADDLERDRLQSAVHELEEMVSRTEADRNRFLCERDRLRAALETIERDLATTRPIVDAKLASLPDEHKEVAAVFLNPFADFCDEVLTFVQKALNSGAARRPGRDRIKNDVRPVRPRPHHHGEL
jgi:hypothetical protein